MNARRVLPSVITALMLIPIAFLTWLLVTERNRGIDVALAETRGLEYALPTSKAARLAALHRGLSFGYLNGNPTLLPHIRNAQAQMDEALAEIETAEVKYGDDLGSSSRWRLARADWQELRDSALTLAPAESFARHTAAIETLLDLMREAMESSGLLFDTQADSYFMIDVALVRLPRVLEDLGQLRGRGAPMFARGTLSDDDRFFVTTKSALIREHVAALRESVASASRHNPALAQELQAVEQGFLAAIQPFIAAAEIELLRGPRQRTPGQFFRLGTDAIDAGTHFIGIAETALRSLLQERVDVLRRNKYVALGVSLLIVGSIFVIATVLVRSLIAQESLRKSREQLELRVQERTGELEESKAALRGLNDKLKLWVVDLEQRYREMAGLGNMVRLLQTCATPAEMLDVAAKELPRLFGGDAGALYVLDPANKLLAAAASWGPAPPTAPTFTPDDCWALRLGRPHVVAEPRLDGHLCRHVQDSHSAYACVPLIVQGETLGVLHLRCAAEQLAEEHRPFLLTVAENLALALANVRLREALRQQAIRDPLTGLYNRRFMEETLERELHLAARGARSLAVVMSDIDHFKELNDRFGHEAGDMILRELARFLKARMRGSDFACRYGGEEMLVILSATTLHEAAGFAEALRAAVRVMVAHEHERTIGPVTISLGVAASPVHGTTSAALLRAADAALYQAKAQGRDRVVVASATRSTLPG
jgi:diguanylate cyclase (GGDEF)-like protein